MWCQLPYFLSSKMPTVLRKFKKIFLGGKRERRKEGKKKWIGREEEKREWPTSFLWCQLENIFLFKSIKINMPTTTTTKYMLYFPFYTRFLSEEIGKETIVVLGIWVKLLFGWARSLKKNNLKFHSTYWREQIYDGRGGRRRRKEI